MGEGELIIYNSPYKPGDIVLLPCGTPGIVKDCDTFHGWSIAFVAVQPITNWWRRCYFALFGKVRFYNMEISLLENLEPQLLTPSEG